MFSNIPLDYCAVMIEHMFVSITLQPPPSPWAHLHVPVVDPTGWGVDRIHIGLRDLERIRRQVEAATAMLVAALPENRDSVASLAREIGISTREARRRRDVAAVVAAIPNAGELLAGGVLSAEHVAALVPVIGDPAAAALAAAAVDQTPEEVVRAVRQHRLDHEHGTDTTRRQRAMRSLRFFNGPEGMIGLQGLLPPIEGATLKGMLEAILDGHWRAEHPERAPLLGAHGGDCREQRMADALLELAGIESFGATQASNNAAALQGTTAGTTPNDATNATGTAGPDHVGIAAPGRTVPTDIAERRAAGRKATTKPAKPSKPTVVIVFDIDKYQADMLGVGPVAVTEALFDLAKADLYYSFVNMHGEILKFGRARRDPTPLQRIAVIARDRTCFYPGCTLPATQCEIHHLNEWIRDRGFTDVEVLAPACDPHHGHVHLEQLVAQRERDGTVTIRQRSTGIIVTVACQKRAAVAA